MITALAYRDHRLVTQNPGVDNLAALRAEENVMLWVDLDQPTPEECTAILERLFALHPLVIEDCLSGNHPPKCEAYEDYLHLVMRGVGERGIEPFSSTELDVILGRKFLITVHQQPLPPVRQARERYIRTASTPVRGPDRLLHTILDLLVDSYQPALALLGSEVAAVESAALHEPGQLLPRILALRKKLATLRQILRPQREVVVELAQGRTPWFRPLLLPYLRDLAEEFTRIERLANRWSEQLILAFRIFLGRADHEANQGIRVLTALTALTLPALVVGGWFGMNFQAMHELHWRLAYPVVAMVTLSVTFWILIYLRRHQWL
jgi:magnesium transporter